MFEDNEKKLYIIVNRMLDPTLFLNATAHLAAGIMRKEMMHFFTTIPMMKAV